MEDAVADDVGVESFVAGDGQEVLAANEDPGVCDAESCHCLLWQDVADLQVTDADIAGVLEPAGGLREIVDCDGGVVALVDGEARILSVGVGGGPGVDVFAEIGELVAVEDAADVVVYFIAKDADELDIKCKAFVRGVELGAGL